MVSPLLNEGTSFSAHIEASAILIKLSIALFVNYEWEYYGLLRPHKRFLHFRSAKVVLSF